MPVQQGVVGPVPPDHDPGEYDKLRRRVLWTMPSGLYVLGTRAGERRNGMTVNWVTQVSSDPKLLASVEAPSHEPWWTAASSST
jgi:flavin reductase (DIM6/NTAB) family NADH-FMN oxidoreductase RutF